MHDFILFLGRFHVLVLHLPIGILLLTVALDLLSRRPRHAHLAQALPLCWAATALTATLTVALGLMHFAEGGFDGASAAAHRNYGISVAAGSVAVWLLATYRQTLYRRVRSASNVVLVFLVAMTGHYGGNLTHGSTYLAEYAPAPLRALAGLPPKRPPLADVNAADPWLDVVGPLLQDHCVECHNPDKRRGQLDLSSLDGLLAGGENGAVVAGRSAADSELYRRVTLPPDHADAMPADGKTPLTTAQASILQWWIEAGTPADTAVNQLQVEPAVLALIASELGLAAEQSASPSDSLPAIAAATLAELEKHGWLARLQSQQGNGLLVSLAAPGTEVSPPMLESLKGVSDSLVELNLAGTSLDTSGLQLLGPLPALRVLNVSNNQLSDDAMTVLSGFTSLQVLNLYGNAGVTDAGLIKLAGLSALQSLYLWGTTTTPAGIEALAASLPGLTVHGGANSEDTEPVQ